MHGAATHLLIVHSRSMALGLLLFPLLAQAAPWNLTQAAMPRAEKHESRHEIDVLEEAWRNAILKSNATAMEGMLADDYMAITPSGTLQTKDQAVTNLRTGKLHITSLNIFDRKVRFYGTTALVTCIAQVQGTSGGGNITGSYRYTHVYARDAGGKWKIVSFEANLIRGSGRHK